MGRHDHLCMAMTLGIVFEDGTGCDEAVMEDFECCEAHNGKDEHEFHYARV